jgi:hypothetical protein
MRVGKPRLALHRTLALIQKITIRTPCPEPRVYVCCQPRGNPLISRLGQPDNLTKEAISISAVPDRFAAIRQDLGLTGRSAALLKSNRDVRYIWFHQGSLLS